MRLNRWGRRPRRWRNKLQTVVHGNRTKHKCVGILIDKSLKNEIVIIRRQDDRIIIIKLVIEDLILNVISAYTPQVCLSNDVKRQF
jgi:hypothetical protein